MDSPATNVSSRREETRNIEATSSGSSSDRKVQYRPPWASSL
jgi:hypothetical protein